MEYEEELKKQELEKLKLEVKKLKKPFFLRPEFLGLFIPFLTIVITGWLNRDHIRKALETKEQKIELQNTILRMDQRDLKKEKEAIRSEIEGLRETFVYRSDSLNRAFTEKTHELQERHQKTIDNYNKELKVVSTELNHVAQQKEKAEQDLQILAKQYDLVIPNTYLRNVLADEFFASSDSYKKLLETLRKPSNISNILVENLIDSLEKDIELSRRIKILGILAWGTVPKFAAAHNVFEAKLSDLVRSEYDKFNLDHVKVICDLFPNKVPDPLKVLLDKIRLEEFNVEKANMFLTEMFKYRLIADHNYPHEEFPSIDSFLFCLEFFTQKYFELLDGGFSQEETHSLRDIISVLSKLAPATFMTTAVRYRLKMHIFPDGAIYEYPLDFVEIIFENELKTSFFAKGFKQKYNVPSTLASVQKLRNWKQINSVLFEDWSGPRFEALRDNPKLLEY